MTDNNKFKKLSCSPESDKDFNFSCYDEDDINKLKLALIIIRITPNKQVKIPMY